MSKGFSIARQWRQASTIPGLLFFMFVIFSLTGCKGGHTSAVASPVPSPAVSNNSDTGAVRNSYADVVSRVVPAVVTIRADRRVRAPQQFPFSDDPFFRDFFGDRLPRGQQPQRELQRALGSGVIVSADGYILTNHHVVDGAEDIKVDLNDNRTLEAKVVGSDQPSDLAVLKVNASSLPVLQPGDSDGVRVGDVVLAIGNPLGVGQTVTMGIISAKGRSTGPGNGSFEDFLQTDAPINQGNSGGALVNTNGELIGINSQILSGSGGNIGIGFAIPSNMARSVMDQLIKGGKVRRGQLGIVVQKVTSDIASNLGIQETRGVIVSSVKADSAAEKAGIKRGDVITAINGVAVNDPNSFRNKVASAQPGTEVTLTILRDNKEQELRATLGEFTAEGARADEGDGGEGGGDSETGKLGIGVQPLTPDLASQLNLRAGTQGLVVMQVDPSGPAAEAGVQRGDVIEEINRQPVRSVADLKNALQRAGERPSLMLINRRGDEVYLTVRPGQ
ncbi:MAG: serine protease Do [Blastocatellia bacterium]|jgi:Do/DeqQ family serine protease|nr:serine protease Do [Blastocatellia bacterium]